MPAKVCNRISSNFQYEVARVGNEIAMSTVRVHSSDMAYLRLILPFNLQRYVTNIAPNFQSSKTSKQSLFLQFGSKFTNQAQIDCKSNKFQPRSGRLLKVTIFLNRQKRTKCWLLMFRDLFHRTPDLDKTHWRRTLAQRVPDIAGNISANIRTVEVLTGTPYSYVGQELQYVK